MKMTGSIRSYAALAGGMLFLLGGLSAQTSTTTTTTTTTTTKTIMVSSDSLKYKDYYGSYKMSENPFVQKVTAFYKDGGLYSQAEGYPESKLIPVKGDEFTEANMGASIIFTRKDSMVTGFKISVQGQEMTGTKENTDSMMYAEYVGDYKITGGPVPSMKVFLKDGSLFGQAEGYPETKLSRVKGDEFTESNFGASINFVRKDTKEVGGFKLSVQGQEMEGVKEGKK